MCETPLRQVKPWAATLSLVWFSSLSHCLGSVGGDELGAIHGEEPSANGGMRAAGGAGAATAGAGGEKPRAEITSAFGGVPDSGIDAGGAGGSQGEETDGQPPRCLRAADGAASFGAEPGPCGAVIGDLEDGTGYICEGDGRRGVWYAFRDDVSTKWPPLTDPGVPILTSVIPGGRGTSRYAIHTYGKTESGSVSTTWGAGVGVDLNFDGTTYGQYDPCAYVGVTFWAKSDTPSTHVQFRVGTLQSTWSGYGGNCKSKDCGAPYVSLRFGRSWAQYRIPFRSLTKWESLAGNLINLQFYVKTPSTPFDFWVDDVSFYRESEPPDCAPPPEACRGSIAFEDKAIEGTVRKAVAKDTGPLTYEDVCYLHELQASQTLTSSGGLECLTGLATLDLESSGLSDIAFVSGMKDLTIVRLTGADIEALAPLGAMQWLTELDISNNRASNIDFLSNLPLLESINASGNRFDRLPRGDFPALRSLDLSDNSVDSVEHSDGMASLQQLLLHQNAISDLRPLAPLPSLARLNVSNDRLETLELSGFPNLMGLSANSNPIKALKLTDMPKLVALDVSDCQLEILDASDLPALQSIRADRNRIERLDTSELANVSHLDLLRNRLQSLDVSRFPALTSLEALGNPLQMLDVSKLGNLEELDLDSNQIRTIVGTTCPAGLKTLKLGSNHLVDLGGLAACSNLQSLDARQNEIADLSSLAGLLQLNWLSLSMNPVSDLRPLTSATGLDYLVLGSSRVDLAPLVANSGLQDGDEVVAISDNVDCGTQREDVDALRGRGVKVGIYGYRDAYTALCNP